MKVHHKNLTSLVRQRMDVTNTRLIYEYMASGNSDEHLSGFAHKLELIFFLFFLFQFFGVRLVNEEERNNRQSNFNNIKNNLNMHQKEYRKINRRPYKTDEQ